MENSHITFLQQENFQLKVKLLLQDKTKAHIEVDKGNNLIICWRIHNFKQKQGYQGQYFSRDHFKEKENQLLNQVEKLLMS